MKQSMYLLLDVFSLEAVAPFNENQGLLLLA